MANLAKLVEVAPEAVEALEAKLRSPETSLPEKYRVLFSLRNIQGREAHEALSLGESRGLAPPPAAAARGAAAHRPLQHAVRATRRRPPPPPTPCPRPQRCATRPRSSATTSRSAWASGRTRRLWRCCRRSWQTAASTQCEWRMGVFQCVLCAPGAGTWHAAVQAQPCLQ